MRKRTREKALMDSCNGDGVGKTTWQLDGKDFLVLLESLLDEGHSVRFRVTGSSMYPSIRSDDQVILIRGGIDQLAVGHVVLVRDSNGQPVLHRILQCTGAGPSTRIFVRGDHAPESGQWVSPSSIVGRVLRVERSTTTSWRDKLRHVGRAIRGEFRGYATRRR